MNRAFVRLAFALVPALTGIAAAPTADSLFQGGITAYTARGDREAARQAFTRALALDPKHAGARFNLGMLAEEEERWGEAIAAFEEYLRLAPDDLYAAVARRKLVTLRQFAELDRTPEGRRERIFLGFVHKAQSRLAAGETGAALALAELAVQDQPQRFEGQLVLGVCRLEAEKYADAVTALAAARAACPPDVAPEVDALLRRARSLQSNQGRLQTADEAFRTGNFRAAAEAYSQVWTVLDAAEFGLQAARAWTLAKDPAKALKIYEVLAKSPDAATAQRAAEEREALLATQPREAAANPAASAPFLRAEQLAVQGKHYEAEAELSQVLAGKMPGPEYADVFAARGAARLELREHAAAAQDLSMALLLNPRHIEALVNRADAYSGLGRFEDAARDFDRLLELRPPQFNEAQLRQYRDDFRAKAKTH